VLFKDYPTCFCNKIWKLPKKSNVSLEIEMLISMYGQQSNTFLISNPSWLISNTSVSMPLLFFSFFSTCSKESYSWNYKLATTLFDHIFIISCRMFPISYMVQFSPNYLSNSPIPMVFVMLEFTTYIAL